MKLEKKTVAENIADLVGLQAAYRAFKRLNVTNRILMGLITDYCPEQLFFLGMAIARCTSESVQFTEDFILDRSQVHSPWKFRVNVSLKNFKAFAKAWNCPSGSEMNPIRNRCTIY
ncbi:phosphate-regulating neutral endopeptidase PHEX-like [Cloeon dipterum]|uniref:phosphate-regulating neutral endopeptidase PHEX-like n=1 Tax=Cloeon dipterum TaxID=197152 RepID=UPI00321F9F0E